MQFTKRVMRPLLTLIVAAGIEPACQPSPPAAAVAQPIASAIPAVASPVGTDQPPSGPPRVVLQVGLPDRPSGFAISKGGALLAAYTGPTGTQNGAICSTTIWDARTTQVRGVLPACSALEFSPDGRSLVSIPKLWGPGGVVSLVEPADRDQAVWRGFSPDGAWAASSHGNAVRVWNTRNASRQASIALAGAVRAVAFGQTTQGAVVAISDASQPSITVWDVSTGQRRANLAGHKVAPMALRFSGGSLLVSVAEDGSVQTWDAESGKASAAQGQGNMKVADVSFSEDGGRFALVVNESPLAAVRIGHTRTLRISAPVGIPRSKTEHLALSPDGSGLLFGGKDGDIGIWSIQEGRVIGHLAAGGRVGALSWARGGEVAEVFAGPQILRWSKASTSLLSPLAMVGKDNTVLWDSTGQFRLHAHDDVAEVWDVAGAAPVGSVHIVSGPSVPVLTGPPDPLGTRIVWPASNSVAIWDTTTGQVSATTVGTDRGNLLHTSWSEDGSTLAMVGPGGYATVVRSGEPSWTKGVQGAKPPERAVSVEASLSANGTLLLLPDSGGLRVVSTDKATVLTTLPTASSGVFSADAKRIAVRDESPYWDPLDPAVYQRVRLWDSERGRYLWSKDWTYLAANMPFSSDGAWVALTPHDINEPGKVLIVNASTGAKKAELRGCAFLPSSDNAWSPRGSLFAHVTACGVTLWDGRKLRDLFAIENSEEWPETPVALAWSPDGSRVASSFGVLDVQSGARIVLEPREGKLLKGVSWSPDGRYVIGLFDFTAVLYEASSGKVLQVWDEIERVAFMHGGKLAMAQNLDVHEPVDLWRIADRTRIRIATLDIPGEGLGWVAYTDDGRFDASPNALPSIRVRMGDDLTGSPLLDAGDAVDRLRASGLVAEFIRVACSE